MHRNPLEIYFWNVFYIDHKHLTKKRFDAFVYIVFLNLMILQLVLREYVQLNHRLQNSGVAKFKLNLMGFFILSKTDVSPFGCQSSMTFDIETEKNYVWKSIESLKQTQRTYKKVTYCCSIFQFY